MKYKDVLRNSLYLDEELQEYFNKMSKKGWRLDFVGYYYRFIKDEHVYKYQIDYTPISSEYQDILKEMGYHEVRNSFDDFRVLENENVDAPDLNTEFVFDKNNKTVALRHEMTTPIARVAASRMSDDILPYKLSYISNVYRYEQTQEGRQCEFYQAGVELMGVAEALGDAEVIALAVDSLQKVGLKNFEVCIGQVDFINGIMQQMGLSQEKQLQIRQALEQRNLVDLTNAVEDTKLPKQAKEALKSIPMLQGKEEVLEIANNLALNEQSRKALDNLHDIYTLLKAYNLADFVKFDLGVIRDFDYYTGMIFEVYAPMIGYPICGGGRYDKMLSDFGTDCPATGFAMGIERLMLALDKQNNIDEFASDENQKDIYVAYTSDKLNDAIALVNELRAEGKVVELALTNQTKAQAQLYIKNKLFKELIYLE